MLDRWDYTGDEAFLTDQVLPMAESVLQYFDTRFKKDAGGRIVLDPTQAVETYWHGVINDMPSTAGLNDITARLCALPEKLTTAGQREFFARMRAACPTVPVEDARSTARRSAASPRRRNMPPTAPTARTRSFTRSGRSGCTVSASRAWKRPARPTPRRHNHLDCGWGYDGNCAALLGLTDEAARILKVKCANSHPAYRWPATWGPNFDWLPDQDHGGNLLETAQLMLLQPVGDKILLLPAWPKNLGRELQAAGPAEHGRRVRLSPRQDRKAGGHARRTQERRAGDDGRWSEGWPSVRNVCPTPFAEAQGRATQTLPFCLSELGRARTIGGMAMRLILSRKGFDTQNGGVPSPILPDGRMCSLPIPDGSSQVRYADIMWDDVSLGKVVSDLTDNRIRGTTRAHLDPDINPAELRRRKGWLEILGPSRPAYTHLQRCGFAEGDLFLFFGWFRQAEWKNGLLRFVPRRPDIHVIFGWLKVETIKPVEEFSAAERRWADYHPHFSPDRTPEEVIAWPTTKCFCPGANVRCRDSASFPCASRFSA